MDPELRVLIKQQLKVARTIKSDSPQVSIPHVSLDNRAGQGDEVAPFPRALVGGPRSFLFTIRKRKKKDQTFN
jgi:hypothetical protein